ncbi:hypothetical protein INS49_004177 [Diaporthe citri]|uniref:uncharacterized protein n=1 Tax=Diaporthe citri TaxID=83186 RepID=UPI001C818D48|nr:uncharacterized protein INS49_004177 [Diaporthe citri]KAG6355096.1 hypothetical protein INS49_004177 [Diaporthe citri]
MASDDSDSDDSFYGAMDRLVESIRESLSPELLALVGRRLFEGQSTIRADPADTLKVLSKFLKLSAKPCSKEVKMDVGNAILDKSDPVNLFFGCLPSPESHEMRHVNGGQAIFDAYDHAHEVLEYFALVHGREKLKTQYKGTLLDKLFEEFGEISRLTVLFQIVFVQYLLSINYNGYYIVSADDGMVKVFMDCSAPEDLQNESIYKGVSPGLDLSLPKVEAALHAFGFDLAKDHFSANGGLQDTLKLPQHQFEEQCLALRETLKSDAEGLLVRVKDFLYSTVGPKDEKFRTITALLSDVYFRMGRAPKAVELQQEILQSCHEHLGTEHPDTFRARDRLGCTKWLQGRFTEARQHQEIAVERFKRLLDIGTNHEYRFEAMDNLGRTIGKFWETHHFKQAYELHHEAVQGLSKVLGPDHDKTLTAKESLCRVALVLRAQRKHTFNPLELITEVAETRKVNFGKEHPLTLLATANLIIAKMEAGHLEDAETMVREGLEVAIRTLGTDYYYGTIHGRDILGCVLIQQGRYAEAQEVFIHVVESQKRLEIRRGDHHPERLASLIQLAKAVSHQGRVKDSIKICEETIEGLEIISKAPHPLRAGMIRARDQMVPLLSSPQHKDHTKVEFPWILFPGGP